MRSTVILALLPSSTRRVTVPASELMFATTPWIPEFKITRSFFLRLANLACNAFCSLFACFGKNKIKTYNATKTTSTKLSGLRKKASLNEGFADSGLLESSVEIPEELVFPESFSATFSEETPAELPSFVAVCGFESVGASADGLVVAAASATAPD